MAKNSLISVLIMMAIFSGNIQAKDQIFVFDIPTLYRSVSGYCGVSPRLLYAVAKVESGGKAGAKSKPWPWTLNVEGAAYYFDTREEQFKKLSDFLAEGKRVDIGLMQPNWYWQSSRMVSPWVATDPTYNVKTACQIIREYYDETGSWWTAIGRYHHPSTNTPRDVEIAENYSQRVRSAWGQIKWVEII